MQPGNIWSGNGTLARFTNPTELARKKGRLTTSYPVTWRGQQWPDVETAYQETKRNSRQMTLKERAYLLVEIMEMKFRTYPELIEEIRAAGRQQWIIRCSHHTGARTNTFQVWEGDGPESLFVRCLSEVYRRITGEARPR